MDSHKIIELAAKKAGLRYWDDDGGIRVTLKNEEILSGASEIIFNHDFAKALWGDKKTCEWCGNQEVENDFNCGSCTTSMETSEVYLIPAWEYYLKVLVLIDNPLEYIFLKSHINPDENQTLGDLMEKNN